MARVLNLSHKRLQECVDAVQNAYNYETFNYSITKVISASLTKKIRDFLKSQKLSFSDYKVYFDKTNVKVFFKLLRASQEEADAALNKLAEDLSLTDVERETAQAVAHRKLTKEERHNKFINKEVDLCLILLCNRY